LPRWCSSERHVFVHSARQIYLQQREPVSTLKTLSCRKWSSQNLTLFSQGNHVLAGAPSLIDGSLGDRNVVLQRSWIGLFGTTRLSFDIEDLSNWRYWV
jgi:hypothetical protein